MKNSRRRTEEAINEVSLEKLKRKSQLKETSQKLEINLHHKENEIKSLKHCIETLEAKLQAAIKDNKSKD